MVFRKDYRDFDGDWFCFEERKGFSAELTEDSNNPEVLAWITRKLTGAVPAGEFAFYVLGVAPDVDHVAGISRRLEDLGIKNVRVRVEGFTSHRRD
jgi:hypothetical protein